MQERATELSCLGKYRSEGLDAPSGKAQYQLQQINSNAKTFTGEVESSTRFC